MSKPVLITVVVVVIVALISGWIGLRIYRQGQLSEAERMLLQGRYQEVINQYQPRITGSSGAADERLALAEAYYRLSQYEKANEVLKPLLLFGNVDIRAAAMAGWIAVDQDSYIQAQEFFNQVKSLGNEAESEAGLGAVALIRSEGYRKSDLNEAEDRLMRALSDPDVSAEAYLIQAEYKIVRHRYEEAIDAVQKAIDKRPNWSKPYVMQGQVYLLTNKSSQAREAFEKALKLGAPEGETKYFLARALYLEQKLPEALEQYQQLISLNTLRTRDALEDTAKIHLVLGEVDTAVEILRKAWTLKKNPSTGMQIFQIQARQEKWPEAEKTLQTVLADYPFVMDAQSEQAHRFLLSQNLSKAYTQYQAVLDNDPGNWLGLYNLGCIAISRAEYYLAPDLFRSAAENNPDYFPAQINYALSLLAAEREDEAQPLLQELSEQFPDNPMVDQARALERFTSGFSDAAYELLSKALQSPSQQIGSLIIQGEMSLRLFQFEQARTSFNQAHTHAPQNIRAILGLAHSYIRLGDELHAEPLYADILKLGTNLPKPIAVEAQNGLALIQQYQDQIETALEVWKLMQRDSGPGRQLALVNSALTHAEQPTADDIDQLGKTTAETGAIPEVFYNLSLLQDRAGNQMVAGESYNTLLLKYPNYMPGLFNLAEWNRRQNNLTEALAYYDRAHRVAPQQVDILNNEAAALLGQDNYDSADQQLEQAAKLEPQNAMVAYNQALVSLHKGDLTQAQGDWQTLKQNNGSPFNSQMVEGLILSTQGKWAEAEAVYHAIDEQAGDDPYVFINRGIALAKLGRLEEAENTLQEALSLDSTLAASQRAMGLLYCQMGLYSEAETFLQTALAQDPTQQDLQPILSQIQGWRQE